MLNSTSCLMSLFAYENDMFACVRQQRQNCAPIWFYISLCMGHEYCNRAQKKKCVCYHLLWSLFYCCIQWQIGIHLIKDLHARSNAHPFIYLAHNVCVSLTVIASATRHFIWCNLWEQNKKIEPHFYSIFVSVLLLPDKIFLYWSLAGCALHSSTKFDDSLFIHADHLPYISLLLFTFFLSLQNRYKFGRERKKKT